MNRSSKERHKPRFVVGIDEVGRGPLAGPVAVGAVLVPYEKKRELKRIFKGIRDSKKLKPSVRERFALLARGELESGSMRYVVSFGSNKEIDRKGIANVVYSLVGRSLKRLKAVPEECEVFLDGSLKAPPAFARQKTVVKGDDAIFEISLASVVAKVARDRRMAALSRRFEGYGFELHKGYGTKAHYEALEKRGPSPIHRVSFIRPYLLPET